MGRVFVEGDPEGGHYVDGVHEGVADGREFPVQDGYHARFGWVEDLLGEERGKYGVRGIYR